MTHSYDLRRYIDAVQMLVEAGVQSVPSELYHGTDRKSLERILKGDAIKTAPFNIHDPRPWGISLTDNHRIARIFADGRAYDSGSAGVILVLDGHKLASRYAVEPYEPRLIVRSEFEWRVMGGTISPLSDFLIRIEPLDHDNHPPDIG